jgi:SH3 domain protein
LLLSQGAVAAETLYVDDQLRLGVRALPEASGRSIAVVTTGDALTVLGEQAEFIQIRTEGGVEGWVSKSYLSAEPPARTRLERLQQAQEALQQGHEVLQQQLVQSQLLVEQRGKELVTVQRDNLALQQQLSRYTSAATGPLERYRWPALLGLLLLCFGVGFVAGVRRKSRQVAERIGGLQL